MSDTLLGKTLINFITKIVLLLGYKLWQLTGEIGLIFLKKNVIRAVSQGVTLMFLGIISVIVMYFVPPYQPPVTSTITGTIIALIFTFGGRYQVTSVDNE